MGKGSWRAYKPDSVESECLRVIIYLGRRSPRASSGLPEDHPDRADPLAVPCGAANVPLFGLAPGGVYRAKRVAPPAGELLPHRFTLTSPGKPGKAVCFLWHFPYATEAARWALPTTTPYGVRTFLRGCRREGSPPTRPLRRSLRPPRPKLNNRRVRRILETIFGFSR